ncbi:MAG: nuclear transport factor 2 family protein [Cyanobacteria bacterium J06592_8]
MNNLEIIKNLYKAFECGDISTILEILDTEVEWIESEGIPYGGVFIGHEAVLQGVFEKIAAEWDNFQAITEEFIDAGDTIITLGFDRGTYKATGKTMQAATASFWTLKAGKVIKFRQYIDTLKVVSAIRELDEPR